MTFILYPIQIFRDDVDAVRIQNNRAFQCFKTLPHAFFRVIAFGQSRAYHAGSAVVASAVAFDRMLCYLPPVCCVVASERMLCEHLPAAWPETCARIKGEAVESKDIDASVPIAQSGEFLIVTGPSRTADIEKILVMGVHGPKRLVVFLVAEA